MRIVAGVALAIGLLGLVPTATGTHLPGSIALGAPRILYSSDWSGTSEIYAVDPSRRLPAAQVTFGRPPSCSGPVFVLACGFTDPVPSPDGRWLLYRDVFDNDRGGGSCLWIARADGGTPRLLAKSASSAAWSPDSRLIAYNDSVVSVNGMRIADIEKREDQARKPGAVVIASLNDFCGYGGPAWSPDGRSLAYPVCGRNTVPSRLGRFRVVSVRGYELAWSPDGRQIAYVDQGNVGLASPSGMPLRAIGQGDDPAWSPDGRSLAFRSNDGLRILSLRTGKTHLLTTDTRAGGENALVDIALPFSLVWAPDSRSLAYVAGDFVPCCGQRVWSGDLRVVDLSGQSRTVVSADTMYGGRMVSLAWTRPPAGLRYRQPLPAPSTRVATDGTLADGPVEFLAADADQVAFATACNTVSTWTPKETTSTLVTGSRRLCGDGYVAGFREDIALAGDSVAWVEVCCNNYHIWDLKQQTLDSPPRTVTLGHGGGGPDIAGPAEGGTSHFDSPVGAGSLLVFSSWQSALDQASGHFVVIRQSIQRAESDGCPCPTLRTDPGPLILDDVDAGRIAAHGNNEIVVLDSNGAQLASVPVKPTAVALSGNDLIVLGPGELRDYDATTATLKQSWPLPNVPSGPDCPYRIRFGCPGQVATELPLRLQDAARGLVAYALNDKIHLLRLSDGTDATVAPGTHARFMNAGLVYADGTRLYLVPFDALPLR